MNDNDQSQEWIVQSPDADIPPRAGWAYENFLLGNTRPVRVIRDERGRERGAEAPDSFEGSALKIANILLIHITSSPEVQSTIRAEFVERRHASEAKHK